MYKNSVGIGKAQDEKQLEIFLLTKKKKEEEEERKRSYL